MRKFLVSGAVIFAGIVASPMIVSPLVTRNVQAADYSKDPRLKSIRTFFTKLDCPAWQYAETFLEAADDYSLDWRLLPSLSYVESSGGKAAINNNFFGWNAGRTRFRSPADAIHVIGYNLSHSKMYRNKSLDAMLTTYNPVGEYAVKVKQVMRQISPTK